MLGPAGVNTHPSRRASVAGPWHPMSHLRSRKPDHTQVQTRTRRIPEHTAHPLTIDLVTLESADGRGDAARERDRWSEMGVQATAEVDSVAPRFRRPGAGEGGEMLNHLPAREPELRERHDNARPRPEMDPRTDVDVP